MAEKKTIANPHPTEANKPPIPQPPTDGFPVGEDISAPPEGSDQAVAEKEKEEMAPQEKRK